MSYMPVSPGVGMEENFLSLDDILLSQERLPCKTDTEFPGLGFLEKNADSRHIPEVNQLT
uniref:DNA replication complex GINS protein PSF3 N-terminal domain-containing protein n=1 Tax=Astyanax mexicanus TaxID=7994 RepID=A0A8B9R3U3_ASTMX